MLVNGKNLTVIAVLIVISVGLISFDNDIFIDGQLETVRFHDFRVNTQLDCTSADESTQGVFHISAYGEILSDGPVNTRLVVEYEPHNDDGSHGEQRQIIIDKHIHRPSNGVNDFSVVEGTFGIPTHTNTDHISEVDVFITGFYLPTNEQFNFEKVSIPIPSCVK